MGVVEDTRKVLQDFLAPELRAIAVRLDALEKRYEQLDHRIEKLSDKTDRRFDDVAKRFDDVAKRFDDSDRRAEARHDQLLTAINKLSDYNEIRERVVRLEAKEPAHQ